MYVGFNNGLVLVSRFFSFLLDSDNVNNKKKKKETNQIISLLEKLRRKESCMYLCGCDRQHPIQSEFIYFPNLWGG